MKSNKKLLKTALVLLVLAVPILAYTQRQAIFDWRRLYNYTAPPAIAQFADQDTMTAKARHIFYVTHPTLDNDVTAFRSDCPLDEKSIVLGCYIPMQSDQLAVTGPVIFLYNITDPRLEGVKEVTAAHEMLHAAYDRLSSKQKANVDATLESFYATQTDQRIIDTINAYKKSEPGDVVNEMHSVFGTEVANLPGPLESYYSQYFTNRAAVTAFAASYTAEFTGRIAKATGYDQQLAVMKKNIDAKESSLNNQLAQLNSDRANLSRLRSSGDPAAYNAGVPGFNAEVTAYNSSVTQLKSEIDSFNALVETRNNLVADITTLYKALDTSLTAQTAQ